MLKRLHSNAYRIIRRRRVGNLAHSIAGTHSGGAGLLPNATREIAMITVDSNACRSQRYRTGCHLHRAPIPEPQEDPLPGEHPVPQDEPVPSPQPEIDIG